MALVPLQDEGEWLGTLLLSTGNTQQPTAEVLQPFLTLCEQTETALANRRLLRETERLYQVSRFFNEAITQEEIYQIALWRKLGIGLM